MNNGGPTYFLRRAAAFARARWCASLPGGVTSPAPVTIQVEITNRCNLSCAMCFQGTMRRPRVDMSRAMFERVVDSAAGWVHHVQLANFGEPLLHPRVHELVAHAAGRGLFVEMITNGTLLDSRCAERLVGAGVGKVSVSVDSLDPGRYRQMRGVELEAALAGLGNLVRARRRAGGRRPFIVLTGTDLVSNPGDAVALRERCRDLGADACYVTPSCNWAGAVQDPRWIRPTGQRFAGCLFPWEFLFVGSAGQLAPCCIDPELRNEVGRLEGDGLRGAFNGAPMRTLRRAILDGDLASLSRISACHACSRPFGSQAGFTLNRLRVELAQLAHFSRPR